MYLSLAVTGISVGHPLGGRRCRCDPTQLGGWPHAGFGVGSAGDAVVKGYGGIDFNNPTE